MFCPKKNLKLVDYSTYDCEQDFNDLALLAYCIAKVVCRDGGGGSRSCMCRDACPNIWRLRAAHLNWFARSDQPRGRQAQASRSSPACALFQGRFEACGATRKARERNTPHFSCHTSYERRRRKSGMSRGKHQQSPSLAPNFQTHLSCDRTTWVTRWDCFCVVVVVAQIKSGPWTKPFDYHRYKTE